MNVLSEIVDWAISLPPWQSDAVRRLLHQGDLQENDRDEILLMLKANNEIATEDDTPKPRPIRKDIPDSTPGGRPIVILNKLGDVQHVNALEPKQALEFAEQGVTVIFGPNAAGKSGYARILKRACNSRTAETILPNLLVASAVSQPAKATLVITANGEQKKMTWTDGCDIPEYLSEIAVFDSKYVRFRVDEHNDVIYEPYGMDIFRKFAELLDWLNKKLSSELDEVKKDLELPSKLLGETEGTPTGDFLTKELSCDTSLERIEKLAELSPDDSARINKLSKILNKDPAIQAEQLRRLEVRIESVKNHFEEIEKGLSGDVIAKLQGAHKAAVEATKKAKGLSEKLTASPLLLGIGSESWRRLLRAAKQYSEEEAYKGQSFPVTDKEARCVLCQQELDPPAGIRLMAFAEWLMGPAVKDAEAKRRIFRDEHTVIVQLASRFNFADTVIFEEIDNEVPGLRSTIESYISSARSRQAALVKAAEGPQPWNNIPVLAGSPIKRLGQLNQALEERRQEFVKQTQDEERRKAQEELKSLKARKALSQNLDAVKQHIRLLGKKKRLEACREETKTQSVSRKQTEVTKKILTEEMLSVLKKELKGLGPDYLELELAPHTGMGETSTTKLKLKTSSSSPKELSKVFSEGEQTTVAIAAFLAELQVSGHTSAVVFDDPVCSLDHEWREKVAKRLVEESRNRQVIVFTHDVAFLHWMKKCADGNKLPLSCKVIARLWPRVGICEETEPPMLMNTEGLAKQLDLILKEAEAAHQSREPSKYRERVAKFYDLLRHAWERLTEKDLFNSTVIRFDHRVQPSLLQQVEVTADDYNAIAKGWINCSNRLPSHAKAEEEGLDLPQPKDLQNDLEDFRKCRDRVKKRGQDLETKRPHIKR